MDQRSALGIGQRLVSGALGLLLMTSCLPSPTRVSPTTVGREGTLKTSLAPGAVGAINRGETALPGTLAASVPLAAPIISNNGANVLKGSVRVPASIISHNGGNIVSNNGGTIISHSGGNIISHNGGNIISHNGGNVRISQVPLAFTTVRLKDAAGNPVKDSAGQDLVTKTDAAGNYAFPVDVKGRNLVIEADVEGQSGKLKSLLPREGLQAGKGLDVDLTSTLTLAYILDQYVKGDLNTFERLPKDIEVKARTVTEEAIVEKKIDLPKTLDAEAIVAKVDEVRSADPEVDQVFEEIKKLLVVAGIVREGDGLRATDVAPGTIGAALRDKDGGLYVFSQSMHNLWKIDTQGILHTIVASGEWGYKEQSTGWLTPGYTSGAVLDATGNLILSDTYNNRVVRISKAGRVSVIAGTGVPGFSGDGGDAKLAQLNRPSGLALDGAGNLYVSDTENHRVRKISPDGKISTAIGNGTAGYSGDGQSGANARLNRPQGLTLNASGDLYIADFANNRIRVASVAGLVSTLRPEVGEIHSPIYLTFDVHQDLLCLSHQSSQVYRLSQAGLNLALPVDFRAAGKAFYIFFSRTLVDLGDKLLLDTQPGILVSSSNDGVIEQVMGRVETKDINVAHFEGAYKMVIDRHDNVFVSDMSAKRISKVDGHGAVHSIAGNGQDWPTDLSKLELNHGIGMVSDLAISKDGDVIFTTIGTSPSVNKLGQDNRVSRLIGSGKVDYLSLPIGLAQKISLANPFSVAVLLDGRIVFAEPVENHLCILNDDGNVDLIVPTDAVAGPDLLEVSDNGTLYVWERGKKQISAMSASGLSIVISEQELRSALGGQEVKALAFDSQSRLHIAGERTIIRKEAEAKFTVVAGEGASVLAGTTRDDGLSAVTDICFSKTGDLYVLEPQQLKRVPRDKLPLP